MILGYLLPNDDIYTLKFEYKGRFEFKKNEKLIHEDDKIKINSAIYGWGRLITHSDLLIESGIGHLKKTNERLIYSRTVNPNSKMWQYLPIALIDMLKAKKLKKQGIKEYFEVYFNEIIGYFESRTPLLSGLALYIISPAKSNDLSFKSYYIIFFK